MIETKLINYIESVLVEISIVSLFDIQFFFNSMVACTSSVRLNRAHEDFSVFYIFFYAWLVTLLTSNLSLCLGGNSGFNAMSDMGRSTISWVNAL